MKVNANEQIPLRARECTNIRRLLWAYCAIVDAQSNLANRIDHIGKTKRFASIVTEMKGITEMVVQSVPMEKQRTLIKNMENQEMYVYTKGMNSNVNDGFTYVEIDSLRELCKIATDECLTCDGRGNSMAKCKLRKVLKGVVMNDLDESDGICMGKKFMSQWED